jgi:serine/threonine protein kinase/lipopolysaccharide biosynthesis regulator YciM
MSDSLSAARHTRAGELFERALELNAAAREELVAETTHEDPALGTELAALLASHNAAPDFLDRLGAKVLPVAFAAFASELAPFGGRVGHYEIVEPLGEGGMGIVYKARDVVLGRLVALKFLPPHLSKDPAAQARLAREARAASALDHPNIAVVHEIGAVDSTPDDASGRRFFIAMAYYDGETLRDKIARGPLLPGDALGYALQLADGLVAAHQAGVVHRDIKPANVLVTPSGVVKIVDFGVAKMSGSDLTREGTAVGTVAYMSPEQTTGAAVDHRTDIWSFGVLLHEMLAGSRPFRGDADTAVIHGIRHDAPPLLTSIRPDVPAPLAEIALRCLAKDPAERYADAGSLRDALSAAMDGSTSGSDTEASVVVLPFANISADPENEYFSDGLTDEVITDLSNIRALRVISRTSAMHYKGSDKDLRAIARELGVRYVLEGGVRKAGDGLRINTRFVDAATDRQLWARKFSGTMREVFEFQEQVARAIVDALRIQLSSGEARSLADRPIADPRAYESYLRARYEAWRFSAEGLERAERYIENALRLVGDNELLYSTLGQIMSSYLEAGIDPEGKARERVEELIGKVFALNPDSARGHMLQSFVAFHRGDVGAAIRAGERAIALTPDDPDTLLLLGYIYAHAGRNHDARALWDRAMQLDPLTPLTHAVQGYLALLEGRFDDAIEPYRRCREIDPESPFSVVCHGWALAFARRTNEALEVLESSAARFRGTPFGSFAAALALALRGESQQAMRAITPEFEAAARTSEMFARAMTQTCALAGDTDRALTWLQHEISLGMLNFDFLAKHDWFLDSVRGEPRFAELLERVRAERARLGLRSGS